MAKKALYLAGGGARGAYQAGVLKGIAHILQVKKLPFEILSGVSVGCINAAILAQNADDFSAGVEKLEILWGNIHCNRVFNSSNYELCKSVFNNLFARKYQSGHLLNTEPLRELINHEINFDAIESNITSGKLEAMEVISHCYETQQTISFYRHQQIDFKDWYFPRHVTQSTKLNIDHILASSALPLFFPTVKISGSHYGDGSIGLVAPLRGLIRFCVERILILGTRPVPNYNPKEAIPNKDIGFAHILGGMLNGLFLDNLDRDIEMVNHMNDIASLLSLWKKRYSSWRPIETLHLRPSIDLGDLAEAQYASMPALLRFFLNILGAKEYSGDLLSFLLFEKKFTRELITLGYQDTITNAEEVNAFFS